MNIGIIGGGSIGLLFAAYLSKTNNITVYTRTEHQASRLREKGITLVQGEMSSANVVNATSCLHNVKDEDLLVIAVKQYVLEQVLSEIKDIDRVSTLLFLQNGMGHIEHLQKLKNVNILLGAVEHGALKVSENKVIHTGIGKTKIAVYKGNNKKLLQAIKDVSPHSFSIENHSDWLDMLTSKLIVNAVINPLTAVLRVQNGELIHNSYFYNLTKRLFNEVNSVLRTNSEDMWTQVRTICENTSKNRSSMLRDIEEGRCTEVDAILGYVLNEAKRMKATVALTAFLYEAIKGIEDRGS